MPDRLDRDSIALRAAQEIGSGQVIALGPGIPSLVPDLVSGEKSPAAWLLEPNGMLTYKWSGAMAGARHRITAPLSFADVSGLVHGGHADLAIVETAWVTPDGNFGYWSNGGNDQGTSGAPAVVDAPGAVVELAACAGRAIAVMRHTGPGGEPNITKSRTEPPDGLGCIALVITDLAVMAVSNGRMTVTELAPGWTFDQVAALTGVPLTAASDLKDMSSVLPNSQSKTEPPQKVFSSGLEAMADLPDGAVVNIDGFAGPGGMPHYLMVSLRDHGAKELTIISNTAGITRVVNFGTPPGHQAIDHSILVENHQIKKAISSYPVSPSPNTPTSFELALQKGEVELEVVPQGTLAERIRAGGAGVAAFYTPTGVGTLLAEGKETRTIDGKEYLLEQALKANYCLIRAYKADTLGNVVYKGTSRNFNPIMATSAEITIVEVDEIVDPGELGPEEIVTPGIYVDRIVLRPADFSPYD